MSAKESRKQWTTNVKASKNEHSWSPIFVANSSFAHIRTWTASDFVASETFYRRIWNNHWHWKNISWFSSNDCDFKQEHCRIIWIEILHTSVWPRHFICSFCRLCSFGRIGYAVIISYYFLYLPQIRRNDKQHYRGFELQILRRKTMQKSTYL